MLWQARHDAREVHPLWREVTCLDGQSFYVNPYTGLLSRTRFTAPEPVAGGILADEMVGPWLRDFVITVSLKGSMVLSADWKGLHVYVQVD